MFVNGTWTGNGSDKQVNGLVVVGTNLYALVQIGTQTARIAKIDIASMAEIASYSAGLAPLNYIVSGLVSDGTNLFFAYSDRPYNTCQVVQVDIATMAEVARTVAFGNSSFSAIGYDGASLYLASQVIIVGRYYFTLRKINPATLALAGQWTDAAINGLSSTKTAISCFGGFVYASIQRGSGFVNGDVVKVNPATMLEIDRWISGHLFTTGLTNDGTNLYIGQYVHPVILYKVDIATMGIVSTWTNLDGGGTGGLIDISYGNSALYALVNSGVRQLVVLNSGLTELGSYSQAGGTFFRSVCYGSIFAGVDTLPNPTILNLIMKQSPKLNKSYCLSRRRL
jgi:hypothetical protein